MRVVLYEWCLSGGLAGGDAAIAREGRMMLEALAADATKDPALDVMVLVEAGRTVDLPSRARAVTVPVGDDVASLVAASRAADWAVVVAPETDGELSARVRAVRAAGGRVLAPADRVIDVASDKQATVDALAGRGIAVPAGRTLAAGESNPAGFHMPAVRKARTGCGGEGLRILTARDTPPASVPTRLEAFTSGLPVGVSCLCGPQATVVLPPLRQVFTPGPAPRYLGSDPLADENVAARARTLAARSISAVGADGGWVGVDLILGSRPDGRDDRVLEVNPRVTTSFVGHARLFATSLVAAMIAVASGTEPLLEPVANPLPTSGSFRLPGG
jgi:predicted ATP-grasp superfamily ATP-dependent carboligase